MVQANHTSVCFGESVQRFFCFEMVSCFWKPNVGICEFSSIETKSCHTTTRVVYVIEYIKCTQILGVLTSCATLGATLDYYLAMKTHKRGESQGRMGVDSCELLAKKNLSLKYKKYFVPRSDDIVLSIVPVPSCGPTRFLCVPPPIAPPALPIAARSALRVSYSPQVAPRV